jgi:putative membrane-bound dehydrogenase-like protein
LVLLLLASLALSFLLCQGPVAAQSDKPKPRTSPLTPEQARAAFKVAPGLRVELVACEPQIESPVAMAFDEDGRLYVVEMRDYPNGPAPGQPPQGRIRVLEDKDGDGFYEHSRVVADNLLFANGVLPWRGGLIVTAAPHIVLLHLRANTGTADWREVLFEGFAAQNPQLRVSHPVLGLDNWIYVANGLRGGKVKRSGKADAKPVDLSGRDFRFDLVHDRYEAISGMGQYGNTFDDWGNRFVCDNRHHLRHVVLPERYLKRNPYLAVPEVLQDTSELPLGEAGAGSKIYPLSKNWTTSNLHAGRFTAACSVFIYRGDLLPERHRGSAFTCDPTGNLVHEEILRQHGATFRSRPPREGVEFLATPDDWCRPVFLALGPDGAMYVVDMCRAVIEHPEFMPPELQKRPDLTWGKDKGRIWRIVPEEYKHKAMRPNLSKASIPDLVKLLEHPNAWWRTTAQRLLLHRVIGPDQLQLVQDRRANRALLHGLTTQGKTSLGRLHAAWLLESWDRLSVETVSAPLSDTDPRARVQGLRLAESMLASEEPIREQVLSQVTHRDAQVRFQTALSLGEWDDDGIVKPLARIAWQGVDDPWSRIAVASAVPRRAGAILDHYVRLLEAKEDHATVNQIQMLRELAALVGARRDTKEVVAVLRRLLALTDKGVRSWQTAGMDGLAEGMARRGGQLGQFLKELPASERRVAEAAVGMLTRSADDAADPKRELSERLTALRLLAHAPWESARPALTQLMADDPAQEIRLAALRSLAAHPRPQVAGLLLKSWRSYTPALRREVTEALLRQPDRIKVLLKEVEAGRVKPGDIDATRIRQLLNHGQAAIRDQARKLLQGSLPADRKDVLARYQTALEKEGNPTRGREIFKKNCATCHRVAGIGIDVGPDISDSRTKTLSALMTDILNPNQAIDNNYVNYVVTTKAGKVLTGMIAAETATSLTLRRAEGQTDTVLRQDVDEVVSSGISLMPEGLEKQITVAEMADLLSFLKNWRYLNGEVPSP